MFPLRAALLFCAPMLVNGIGLPYFPVFLEYLHMSDAEIGIILAMPHLVRMVGTPLGALLADRARDRSTILIWSGAISLVTALILFFTHSFWAVLFVFSLQGLFYAPYLPVAEAVLLTGVRRWGYDYGSMRLWGSVAFVFATMMGGTLFDLYGARMVLPSMAAFFVLTIIVAVFAPRLGTSRVAPIAGAAPAPVLANPLLRPDFLLVLIGASIINGSHGMLFGFASIYWTGQGFTGHQIGIFWTAGVVAEIGMFYYARRLTARFSIWKLLLTGGFVTLLRWLLFSMPMGFYGHLLLQCTHAFSFALVHVSIQRFMIDRAPERHEASAQGLYTTFTALFNAATAFGSGLIYQRYGVDGFNAMAVFVVFGLLSIVFAQALQPQRLRSGG